MKTLSKMLKLAGISALSIVLAAPAVFAAPKQKPAITMAQARATAQAAVPAGKIKSAELEHENGQFIYSFDVKAPDGIQEVWIDAMTGKIVKVEHETAAKEKAEKVQEGKEARSHKAKSH